MLRRPFCGMALCFLLGILSAAYMGSVKPIWIILFLVMIGVFFFRHVGHLPGNTKLLRMRIMICLLMVCIGYGKYVNAQAKRESYLPGLTAGQELAIQGKVTGKQFQNNQYIYELSSCILGMCESNLSAQELLPCNHVFVYSNSDVCSIGEILVLNGKVKLWDTAVNEGNFDAFAFYSAREIDFGLIDIQVLSVHGKKCKWKENLFVLKNKLRQVYQSEMAQETCGVITTMVLGDKTLLDEETKRIYQTAGLSHIMAISGLHISVIGMSLYQFLRKRGMGFLGAGTAVGILLYFYGTMVGMGTSVQRALGMFVLFLLAQTIGHGYDSLNALGVMAFVLMWNNPFLPWDAGFQFSFAAIIGVVWMGGCVSFEELPNGRQKQRLFVSMAVLLTTLPLAAWHYYEIPLYALPMNLLVLPLMGILLALGVAGGFLGLIWIKGGGVILFFCEKFLVLIRRICMYCIKLPYSMVIVGRPKLWQVICYYMLLILIVCLAYRRREEQKRGNAKRVGQRPGDRVKSGELRKEYGYIHAKDWKKFCMNMIFPISFAIIVLLFPATRNMELDFLDVGQGDGAFLRTAEGHHVFVDGGSTSVKQVGTYRMIPFLKYKGVRCIDLWFVSHTDEDHISGLREALEAGYKVKYLVVSHHIVQDEVLEELQNLAIENGTKIMYVSENDVLHLGDAKFQVLYPMDKNVTSSGERDKNETSLVILYEDKNFSAIFTGDIGEEQEKEILLAMQEVLAQRKLGGAEVDVYKAAHHGSKYSNSMDWIRALQPKIATISCGKNNIYGHPGVETLQRLSEVECWVLRTDWQGEIRIIMDKEGNIWKVESMKRGIE